MVPLLPWSWFRKAFRSKSGRSSHGFSRPPSLALPPPPEPRLDDRFSKALEQGYDCALAVVTDADVQRSGIDFPVAVNAILKMTSPEWSQDQKVALVFSLLTHGFGVSEEDMERCLQILVDQGSQLWAYGVEDTDKQRFYWGVLKPWLSSGLSPDVRLIDPNSGSVPLVVWAASHEYWAVVVGLLAAGAKPGETSPSGENVLHLLCDYQARQFSCSFDELHMYSYGWPIQEKMHLPSLVKPVPLMPVGMNDLLDRLLDRVDVSSVTGLGQTAFSLSCPQFQEKILAAFPDLVLEGTCRVKGQLMPLATGAVATSNFALLERLLKQDREVLVTPTVDGHLPTWGFWELGSAAAMCKMIAFLKKEGAWRCAVDHVSSQGESFLTYGLAKEKRRCGDKAYQQLPLKLERLVTELPTSAWVEVAPNGESASFWLLALSAHFPGLTEHYVYPRRAAILEASLKHVTATFGPSKPRF